MRNTFSTLAWNQFYYSGFVQHELGHARYLIDVYGFNVYHDTNGSVVEIREGDTLVAGSPYMPGTAIISNQGLGLRVHTTLHQGLMNAQWTWVDRYSALALNRIAGQRATTGNYNEPENLGVFLLDLPRDNQLTLLDTSGVPLASASVRIYQASPGDAGAVYAKALRRYPGPRAPAQMPTAACFWARTLSLPPASSLTTSVTRTRWRSSGWSTAAGWAYGFLEAADFNVEYWLGTTELGEHELRLELISPSLVRPSPRRCRGRYSP